MPGDKQKRRGASDKATPNDSQQKKPYQSCTAESSLNLEHEIGELLFCLQFPVGRELSHIGWGLFERRLRQRVDLKKLE